MDSVAASKPDCRPVMSRLRFYLGLTLALAERRRAFVVEGARFHRAFLAVVDSLRDHPSPEFELEDVDWIRLDPVFGVVPEARAMLLEAEHDRLPWLLDWTPQRAELWVEPHRAAIELGEFPEASCLRRLARTFDEALRGSK